MTEPRGSLEGAMQLFTCENCQQVLYFESVRCTQCGWNQAYLVDERRFASFEAPRDMMGSHPFRVESLPGQPSFRLCQNDLDHGVCNWAVANSDQVAFCRACRLNQTIPNLSHAGAKQSWHRMEIAKRRLLHTLFFLGLPVEPKSEVGEGGLAFAFLEDGPQKIFTGHSEGLVTINLAEADDPFREKMRVQMGEPYRTLLGHFRHEVGHYYWDRLIRDTPAQNLFRQQFGDEQVDYASAQQRHYQGGPPADWQARFVSAYASMHPWEDWAETWAHYLHMTDTLETARAYGLALKPQVADGGSLGRTLMTRRLDLHSFDDIINGWVTVTLALNSLNRSMGLTDPYPFVLSAAAIEKLRFVHEVVVTTALGGTLG